VFLSQGLQHLFVALATADLLPAPPVKSGFVAVDSGHVHLLPCGLVDTIAMVKVAGILATFRYERSVESDRPHRRSLKSMLFGGKN
jgi:hypothetical protein